MACKPGSVPARRQGTTIPLEPASPQASRGQPEGQGGNAPAPTPCGAAPAPPIRPCSRWGLPCRPRCRGRGALLPHRFTLAARPEGAVAVCFLWHCPWGRPRRSLTGTVFPWSPDFPPATRSLAPPAAVQPSGTAAVNALGGGLGQCLGRVFWASPRCFFCALNRRAPRPAAWLAGRPAFGHSALRSAARPGGVASNAGDVRCCALNRRAPRPAAWLAGLPAFGHSASRSAARPGGVASNAGDVHRSRHGMRH